RCVTASPSPGRTIGKRNAMSPAAVVVADNPRKMSVLWGKSRTTGYFDGWSSCAEVHSLSSRGAGCARRSKGKGEGKGLRPRCRLKVSVKVEPARTFNL